MKTLFAVILCMLFAAPAMARDITFAWTPNTEPTLAGYKIHAGTVSGDYTEIYDCGLPAIEDNQIIYTITTPDEMTHFACTAYDSDGFESDYSDEVVSYMMDSPFGFHRRVTIIIE